MPTKSKRKRLLQMKWMKQTTFIEEDKAKASRTLVNLLMLKEALSVAIDAEEEDPSVQGISTKKLIKDFQDKMTDAMKAKLDWPKDDDESSVGDSDWDCTGVVALGKLLSDNLHTCFRIAIKKIAENGYSDEDAEHMILRCGPFYGTKDMVSDIVDCALNCLKNKRKRDDDSTLYTFETLDRLVEYMKLEMVTMLKEVKPSLSVREAIWNLLICDLNVVNASAFEGDPLKFPIDGGVKIVQETKPETKTESRPQETIDSNTNPQSSSKSGKRIEEKCPGCRKLCSGKGHKNVIRHKSLYFENQCKGRLTKGALKAKLASLGDLTLDSKQSTTSSSSSVDKNTSLCLKETEEKAKAKVTPKPETVPSSSQKTEKDYLAGIPYDESKGEHVPRDEKDQVLLAAYGQLQSMKQELQSWDDWANKKVMQVTKRLGQDRQELNMLRAEKEDEEKAKKDKQLMAESWTKRLSEMTVALNAANGKIEMANSAVARLEREKAQLKKEMEIGRYQSSCQANALDQALCKEQETLKKSQSFGSEKKLLEDDLKALKRQVNPIQRELEKVKGQLKETETRLAKEERETAKFVKQAESIRKERELLEALAKEEEKIAMEYAQKELSMMENEMKRIQYEISAIKLESETKKIAAMRKGMDWQPSVLARRADLVLNTIKNQNMSQKKKKNDRECVMCLTEEMTVVFIPCGHQVLCAECSVLHEKYRMNECPSCRTPIQKRINARFAKS